jgi:3-hydroxybutyryl-CoA dehydrogenase
MGAGIAQVVAHHGYEIVACEVSADLVQAGLARIGAGFGRHVERGRMTAAEREGALARVAGTTDLDAFAGCDLIVEAIVEDADAKTELLAELGELAGGADLATTTSSLSVSELGERSGHPKRLFGLHPFNPVVRMELVELCLPKPVDEKLCERAKAWCHAMGKTVVEVPDQFGFVVNRLLFPFLFDAVRLLEDTKLEPEDLDRCMTLGAAHPMGPLALLDMIGLDVAESIGEQLVSATGDERDSPPKSLRKLVKAGKLGRKTAAGFYDYD